MMIMVMMMIMMMMMMIIIIIIIIVVILNTFSTRCLRHCAKNSKVAGSIPNGVIVIFHWHNPSGSGIDSAFNRNEYQEYFLGVKAAFMCWLSWDLGASTSWNPMGLSRPVMGLLCSIPNTCFLVRKFLSDEVHLSLEEAGNFYSCHCTMFPALYFHFSIPCCNHPAETWFSVRIFWCCFLNVLWSEWLKFDSYLLRLGLWSSGL